MLHPTLLADLAREHQADLYRSAEQHRLARAALAARRAAPPPSRTVGFWQRGRRRLGLLLLALGGRLTSVPERP
jgi:hypothetical protein